MRTDALKPTNYFEDSGRGYGGGYGHTARNVHACASDVTLFVMFDPDEAMSAKFPAVDLTPHTAGVLRAGTELSRERAEGEYVRIDLGIANLISEKSHFLVRATEFMACKPATQRAQ